MQRLLIVGCGDIGLRAAKRLRRRYRVIGLAKSEAHAAQLRNHNIIPLAGNLDVYESLNRIAGIAEDVLHFCPPPREGERDMRTRNLLAALASGESLPRRLVYISTSGVYGNCDGEIVPETRPVSPQTNRAKRRYDAEKQLREWGKRNRVAVAILRTPGIYAEDRLPIERLKSRAPVLQDEDDVYTNHIHADDLASVAVAALERSCAGRIYNVCDESELKMAQYFELVAHARNLPPPPKASRASTHAVLAEGMLSFMSESRRLSNDRMLRELRVRLAYRTVADGLQHGG